MDEDGFYFGELNGKRGLVPSNFLQHIPQKYLNSRVGSQNVYSSKNSSDSIKVCRLFIKL